MSAKKPKVFTFEEEMEKLLEKHRFADWAVVVRSVDGQTRGFWVAGDGQNPVGDRERAMVLHGEMTYLQASILDSFKPQTDKSRSGLFPGKTPGVPGSS